MTVTVGVVLVVVIVSVVVSGGVVMVFVVMNLFYCMAFLAVCRLRRVKPTCCHGG